MTPVAFLVSRFPAETFILAQVEGLLERGTDVEVYALASGNRETEKKLQARWDKRLRIHHIPISKSLPSRAVSALPLLFGRNRAALSPRYGDDATSLRLIVAAARWPVMTSGPRVWLAQYGRWGRFACALRDLGIISGPVATMFHGKDMSAYLDRQPHAYDTLVKQGDLFLPISELWRSRLLALGAPSFKTHLHRMGVDTTLFTERHRTLAPGDPVRFIAVGRMVDKKAFDDAVAAFATFQSQPGAPPATLTLIGDGKMHRAVQAQAAASGHSDKIRFTGLLPNDRVAAELDAAHIFLLPSRTAADGDMEGIPVAIMEAMAQGMPVLTTRHSGIPELVTHDVDGLLSAERDRDGLARNMAALAASPQRWPEMGARGADRVRRDFDLRSWNDRLAHVMQDLARTGH